MSTFEVNPKSIKALLDCVTSPCDLPDERRSSHDDNTNFNGVKSFSEAIELARKGWLDGMEETQVVMQKLYGDLQMRHKKSSQLAAQGLFVDVAEYLTDSPENFWQDVELEELEASSVGQVVKILVNGTIGATIDKNIIVNRGAGILTLVDLLEAQGKRVELSMVYAVWGQNAACWQSQFQLKAADEALDIASLSFWLAHPAALRVILFSLMEHEDNAVREIFGFHKGGIYGHIKDWTPPVDVLYFPHVIYSGPWKTQESTEAHIKQIALTQGVRFDEE